LKRKDGRSGGGWVAASPISEGITLVKTLLPTLLECKPPRGALAPSVCVVDGVCKRDLAPLSEVDLLEAVR